ncbi:MAG: 4Fe-4S ferredoxin [Spirochaetaceae bacterium]|nr:MAG: 4Fe-4S ferredoxin [Spirochaetaceae bacterium]
MSNADPKRRIGLRSIGVLSERELSECPGVPSPQRLKAGPVVVIECNEEIPCNPCETLCEKGAIRIGQPITNTPVLEEEKCGGCGLCLAPCPGLAIFLVDASNPDRELVSFPFEFLPLPERGQIVDGLDRSGQVVTEAEVLRIQNPVHNNHTPIITLRVPPGYGMKVRSIRL